MHGSMIGHAIEEEDLVKSEAEHDANAGMHPRIAGFLRNDPVEGGLPADGAAGEFLRESTIRRREMHATEGIVEQRFEETIAISVLTKHSRGNFSWFLSLHPVILADNFRCLRVFADL
jgi:hypothetical protein